MLTLEVRPACVIYNDNVTTKSDTTGKNYIGLTERTFKQKNHWTKTKGVIIHFKAADALGVCFQSRNIEK